MRGENLDSGAAEGDSLCGGLAAQRDEAVGFLRFLTGRMRGGVSTLKAVGNSDCDWETGVESLRARRSRVLRRQRARPRLWLGILILMLSGSGCALFPLPWDGADAGSSRVRRRIPLRIDRPDAPVGYDVLVAEMAQLEGDFELAREALERAALKDPASGFIHDRLARLAWQLDDLDTAVREAELAFELEPESIGVRLFLGRLYRLSRNLEGLDRVLRDAEGRPLDADSAYALFQVAFEGGDLEQAEALARELQSIEPDQLRGTLAITGVFEQRNDFDAAELTIREALGVFPDHFLLFMRLAQIQRKRGDRAAEIAVYREVLESHPRHYGILQRLAQSQVDDNDIEAGIESYQRIVEVYPGDQHALRRLAALEFSIGRNEAAVAHLESVLALDPDESNAAFALGQILRASDDSAGALAAFDRIRPAAPIYIDARIQIASIHQSEGRIVEALAEIDRVRSVRRHRALDFQAAALRIEVGDFAGGVALLESLLDDSEADTEVYYQLGIHYGARSRVEEALEYMQRVLEADPNNANALNYVGYTWAERGVNLEESEVLIRRALEISPEDGYITDSLGWVYYKLAESHFEASRSDTALRFLDRAHAHLLEAAELTGGDSVVSEHLGDVLLLRGDKQGALDYYEEAVGMEVREDEQPMLTEKLDRLRRLLGRDDSQGHSNSSGEAP
jgi:tetratricopeptide (TPR) repeat protein